MCDLRKHRMLNPACTSDSISQFTTPTRTTSIGILSCTHNITYSQLSPAGGKDGCSPYVGAPPCVSFPMKPNGCDAAPVKGLGVSAPLSARVPLPSSTPRPNGCLFVCKGATRADASAGAEAGIKAGVSSGVDVGAVDVGSALLALAPSFNSPKP